MNYIAKAMDKDSNTKALTFETMMEAIEALKKPELFPEEHPLYGVYECKELAALRGSQIMIISGETAYYNKSMFELKEVKVLKLPKMPDPELRFSWNLTITENLTDLL